MYTTQKEIRKTFWEQHPEFQSEFRTRKKQNDYKADIRFAFIDYVEYLRRSEQISESLANRATL